MVYILNLLHLNMFLQGMNHILFYLYMDMFNLSNYDIKMSQIHQNKFHLDMVYILNLLHLNMFLVRNYSILYYLHLDTYLLNNLYNKMLSYNL